LRFATHQQILPGNKLATISEFAAAKFQEGILCHLTYARTLAGSLPRRQ